jgi:hypothetical protein
LQAALADAQSAASFRVVLASDAQASDALTAAGVTVDSRAESYAIVSQNGSTLIVGRDAVGAMYGALEAAERVRIDGPSALPPATAITGAPAVALRAANPFLVLPASTEKAGWWFRDLSFWTEYLDMLARARFDFLDLHAMYDVQTTIFPNALLYFASSPSFPNVGVSAADRAANLDVLKQVVTMAAVRGIRVGLMSYRIDTSPRADGAGVILTDPDLTKYTREAVADLARNVPNLAYLGFRIGESTTGAAWFSPTYVAGLADSGTGVRLYTRTWLTTKPDILAITGAAGSGMIVEAKYNGEHFAAPYAIAGGAFTMWGSYSYQDFLEPPDPYAFVFQVRTGGTHRIFRFASASRARRTALSLSMSPRIAGFSVEPAHAYSLQRDFYHQPQDVFSPWTFRRDELSYLLMGRMAYDPATPESRFRALLAARLGTDALWDPVQAEADIVPWIQTMLTCGPDSRDYAPELELGGSVASWAASPGGPGANFTGCAHHGSFDGFSLATPSEAAQDLVAGQTTTRLLPTHVASIVLADAARARAAAVVPIGDNVEARDFVRECIAVADLGEWFAHKLRAATALAVYERTGSADWLTATRSEINLAAVAFTRLAADTSYIAPFEDRLRMAPLGYLPFHWRAEVPRLADDVASIDAIAQSVPQSPPVAPGPLPPAAAWLNASRPVPPGLASLTVSPQDPSAPSWAVTAVLSGEPPAGAHVRILWKPFRSESAWTPVDASGAGTVWNATIAGGGAGALFAVEIEGPAGQGWRLPDVLAETPYRVLAP